MDTGRFSSALIQTAPWLGFADDSSAKPRCSLGAVVSRDATTQELKGSSSVGQKYADFNVKFCKYSAALPPLPPFWISATALLLGPHSVTVLLLVKYLDIVRMI